MRRPTTLDNPSSARVFFLIVLLCCILHFTCQKQDCFAPTVLTCEYMANPLGINAQRPRLGWEINSDESGAKQSAFQILVASSKEKLAKNIGDKWDSGTVASDQSIQVVYGGEPLHSREKCWWKVRVWDEQGRASKWSELATWESALSPHNWQAKWTGVEEAGNPNVSAKNPALYFRKEFHLADAVEQARVYISGLGYYELFINGKKVGDHVLSPNHTNYDRRQSDDLNEDRVDNMSTRVLYETFDIAPYLQAGENVVGVCLGAGWYFQNERNEDIPFSYDTPRFIAQLEVDLADGGKTVVVSDASWKTHLGPILHNGIFSGEIYDARLEMPGWNDVDFNDGEWRPASLVRAPEGRLTAQMSPPDRVVKTIRPVALKDGDEGIVRYDFGRVFSGWAKLKVQGPRGAKMTLKFMEDSGANYGQTDVYILKGGGLEVWEPRFTWHAFRYVDVIDPPVSLTLGNIEGRVVNTDIKAAGEFSCSNPLFNQILQNYKWTQTGNVHGGVPSDCPHRERRGYTGDGQISATAAIYNFDMRAFYTKWINDIADAQNSVTGYVPNTAPFQHGGGGAPWGSAYVIVPWNMYLYYADKRILEQHYAGMKKWISWLEANRDEDGIIIEPNLGEWVPPQPTEIPPSLVSTAYFYYDLTLMAKMARVLEKDQDASRFDDLAARTKIAFHEKYYNPVKKCYSIGWQGANVFPLGFDMVPDSLKKDVSGSLVRNIEKRAKGHFDTGMMGTPLLLKVLTDYGRSDLAYTLMNQRDFPSFGFEIESGATTIWENWQGDASHSHPMFGSVCTWFYRGVAGIAPDPEQPGFKHIVIHPHPVDGLTFAGAAYKSSYGEIKSKWEMRGDDFILRVSIPANTSATICVPAQDKAGVRVDGQASFVALKNDVAQFSMGAGDCSFNSRNISALIPTPSLASPTISPLDTLAFVPDGVAVRIAGNNAHAAIRYTTDGSEPTPASPLYTKPFIVHQSCVVKARAFYKTRRPGPIAESTISFIDPVVNGVHYDYYEGAWKKLPDFETLTPVKSGVIHDIGLENILAHREKFGVVFKTDLLIAEEGEYTFYLVSNDGSRLFVNGERLLDNDGPHGALEKNGEVRLAPGRHTLRIDYFQAGGGMYLRLFLSGPGMKKQRLPAAMLFAKEGE